MIPETSPQPQGIRERWEDCIHTVATQAMAAMPDDQARIQQAVVAVLRGDVTPTEDGAQIASQSRPGITYSTNGTCTCEAYRFGTHLCVHRIALRLHTRASALLEAQLHRLDTQESPVTLQNGSQATFPPDVTQESGASPQIDPKWLVLIAGKPFVRYAGLLDAAHKAGLVSLTATWTANEPELSLAHAVAVFADGRRFEECGDAAPATVSSMVAKHFRRVSLTRAKARALRDALGCDLVAVEELE